MDTLLNSFVKTIIDNLNKKELQNLLDLINKDDENLYNFKNGIKTNIDQNIINLLIDFKKKY